MPARVASGHRRVSRTQLWMPGCGYLRPARKIGDGTDALSFSSTHGQRIGVIDFGGCEPNQPTLGVKCSDPLIGFISGEFFGYVIEGDEGRPRVLPIHVHDPSLLKRANARGREPGALMGTQAARLQELSGHFRDEKLLRELLRADHNCLRRGNRTQSNGKGCVCKDGPEPRHTNPMRRSRSFSVTCTVPDFAECPMRGSGTSR